MKKKRKNIRRIILLLAVVFIIGLLLPQNLSMPVEGATENSYNKESFWYYPWGKSVTHKGVDIFAKKGTPVRSSTYGITLITGKKGRGGNGVIVLGPKWRLHYYAHLDVIHAKPLRWVTQKTVIGTVGDTGNAKGKPFHLHYSIGTIAPYLWRIDNSIQGWKKMFYLNPIDYLEMK